jgi:hypothetical protein
MLGRFGDELISSSLKGDTDEITKKNIIILLGSYDPYDGL